MKLTWVALLSMVVLTGCDDDGFIPRQPDPTDTSSPVAARVEMHAPPTIAFDATRGTTSIAVHFVARTSSGAPIARDDLEVTILVDGAEVDNEALLDESSEELETSLVLWPTLDASYSMTQHTPPAFGPMLVQAQRTVTEGRDLHAGRPGDFSWKLAWFNEFVHFPAGPGWAASTILHIAPPGPGALTKLFAAVAYQARQSKVEWEDAGSPDNESHLMLVFSDGADNYSHFDNSAVSETVTGSGSEGSYVRRGYETTTLDDALNAIGDHPALQVHVIGMGDDVNETDLQAIAEAGRGRYVQGSPEDLETLFGEVINEFTTVQSRGVLFPWPAGEYTFELRLNPSSGDPSSRIQFRFRAGDVDAGVIDEG
jgi:hypothetical protein